MLILTHDDPIDQEVGVDPFYGSLNVKDFQEIYRVPASMAPTTIVRQLDLSFAEVWPELADWRAEQEAAGVGTLPAALLPLYSEAVFTLYFTDQSEGIDQDELNNEARYFGRSDHFINRIKGVPESGIIRATVL